MTDLSAAARNVNWLVEHFVGHIPGVSEAVVVSADGLPMAVSKGLEPDAADRDLNANTRDFLSKVYYALSGDYDFGQVMAHPPGTSYRDALPTPPPFPWPWLSEADLDVCVAAYEKSGFTGGLNWYRSMDIKWEQRKALEQAVSDLPTYFIGSENDVDLEHFHGDSPLAKLKAQFPQLKQVKMIPEAGHLMQLERSDDVNRILLAYLHDIKLLQ